MTSVSVAQPDVTLLLDLEGVITRATLSSAVGEERVDAWIGRPWAETVDGGSGGVRHLVDDALRTGVSAFRLVTQRFPSGLELPIEYTTVRLGGDAGLLAVGKNLQAVNRVQSRLISSQRSLERDSWKLREVETRYRLLFDTADQAVLVVQADDHLRVVEANPAAVRAIGADPVGRDVLDGLAPADRGPLRAMLARVREHGKAPGLLVRLGGDAKRRWQVKALRMAQEPDAVILLQFAPASAGVGAAGDAVPVEALIEAGPDGFVVLDAGGAVVHANQSFLELVQAPAKATVLGQPLGRWLGRPGADLNVLLENVQRHGNVRRFSTTLLAELGSETEVEVSAFGDTLVRPRFVGLLIRDVGGRPSPDGSGARAGGALGAALGSLDRQVGKTPLLELVRTTVGEVERHFVSAALEMTRGNRTAAAELLGLSRQSLYAKLWRYGLDGGGEAASD
jgi:transcriptional regulator PpsR